MSVTSSSASRNRVSKTCRAVVAAMRPKPSGVSSYSRMTLPSSSRSLAITTTWPVLRSTETRARSAAPTVCMYATCSACSIVSTTTSSDRSFSRTNALSALTSISMVIPQSVSETVEVNSTCTRPLAMSVRAMPTGSFPDVCRITSVSVTSTIRPTTMDLSFK